MINQAITSKKLYPNLELIEPTTGNTGISLAMVSAILGYRFTAVMPDKVSLERRKLLKAYGAKIILTEDDNDINLAKKIVNEQRPEIQTVGLNSRFPTKIQGLRNLQYFRPAIFEKNLVDQIISIDEEEAAFTYMML